MNSERGRSPGRSLAVALVGITIAAAYIVRVLAGWGFDPSIFLALGEDPAVPTDYARDLLGEVVTRTNLGHDGKYFFAQANDPLYTEPEAHAVVLDRPIYRGQRMLYPFLAGGGGAFPPQVVVWSLVIVNLAAVGVGTFATAQLSQRLGASPWLGLAFPINVGVIGEIDIDGAGVVAFALAMVAIWMVYEGRMSVAALALSGAALAREVMLGVAVGLVVGVWFNRRRFRPVLLVPPALCVVAWNLYLRWRLADLPAVGDTREIAPYPLAGIIRAIPQWVDDGTASLLAGLVILILLVVFSVRALLDRSILAWAALPFVALASMLSISVWLEPMDIARGIVPVLTIYPLLVLLGSRRTKPVEQVFD